MIDPEDAVLFVRICKTDAAGMAPNSRLLPQAVSRTLGGSFDLFTGQDTRLHTPPFDNPIEIEST